MAVVGVVVGPGVSEHNTQGHPLFSMRVCLYIKRWAGFRVDIEAGNTNTYGHTTKEQLTTILEDT